MGVQHNRKKTSEIVKKFLSDPQYQYHSKRSLSEIIYRLHPLDFSNCEHVRTTVRTYTGATGDKHRGEIKGQFHRSIRMVDYTQDRKPYILKGCKSIGVVSDIHIPNHRSKAVQLAYETLLERNIDCLLLNGDIVDNTPYTHHKSAPVDRAEAIKYLEMTEQFLEETRLLFPDAKIIWLEGNHDNWYAQYLYSKAPILFGDGHYTLQDRLHLKEYDIEWLEQERYLMAGKLAIAHGHFLLRGVFSPVNTARGIFMKAKANMMVGHSHVSSSHTETNLHGDIVTTWSTGCLCALNMDYAPMASKANHGFAHITLDKSGEFTVDNYRIHNDKLYK